MYQTVALSYRFMARNEMSKIENCSFLGFHFEKLRNLNHDHDMCLTLNVFTNSKRIFRSNIFEVLYVAEYHTGIFLKLYCSHCSFLIIIFS